MKEKVTGEWAQNGKMLRKVELGPEKGKRLYKLFCLANSWISKSYTAKTRKKICPHRASDIEALFINDVCICPKSD